MVREVISLRKSGFLDQTQRVQNGVEWMIPGGWGVGRCFAELL